MIAFLVVSRSAIIRFTNFWLSSCAAKRQCGSFSSTLSVLRSGIRCNVDVFENMLACDSLRLDCTVEFPMMLEFSMNESIMRDSFIL